ncbi:MAG TPA: hypothetical protein VFF19_10130 [Reyranella sp.]|jgi:hypothetical protein|nr:hypothetical protein [Reyranella sp.]
MAATLLGGLLGACSSVPDVQYNYYLPRASSTVTLTRTVICNADKTDFIFVDASSVNTSYSADRSVEPVGIRIKGVEGGLALFTDSEMGLTFYDDGRLKGVNQSTTGQGEAIIKAAASIAATIAPMGMLANVKRTSQPLPDCDVISRWGDNKPISIVYAKGLDLLASTGPHDLDVVPGSARLKAELPNLPPLAVEVGQFQANGSGARFARPQVDKDMVPLTLREVGHVRVEVKDKNTGRTISAAGAIVPGTRTYDLPIPKAALFGKQSFALALAESGAITSISYGKTAGAAGMLNSANTIVNTVDPPAATKAAAVKAEADLILQQQRLVTCQTKPADCK